MSHAFEPLVAQRWARGTLLSNAELAAMIEGRVYYGAVPQGLQGLCVVLTVVSAEDSMVVGATRVWTNILLQVEAWGQDEQVGDLSQAAALVDVALHGSHGRVGGADPGAGLVLTCTRERPLFLPSFVEGDVVWRRFGGEYRLYVQP